MKQLIERNAAEICRLHRAIHDAFAHRSEGPEAFETWKQACATFHARYDALAFPGGLTAGLERLVAGDLMTAETAIVYLELHPYFFRSQYNATMLIRRLKKLQLPAHLRDRFEAVLAAAKERKLRRAEKRKPFRSR